MNSSSFKNLEVGSRIDIADPEDIWSSATICSLNRISPSAALVEVRYDGWDTNWNEEVPLSSKRLAPIYTHTARLKCFVKLPFKRKSKSKKDDRSSWPCVLNIRMPSDETGEDHLSTEKNVFVEPYRPDLLPGYLKQDWKNGGMWLDTKKVHRWQIVTSSTSQGQGGGVATIAKNKDKANYCPQFSHFPASFRRAYIAARDDRSVPGTLNQFPFSKGSLVLKPLRVVKLQGSAGWSENRLVDLNGWVNSIVNLDALQKIIPVADTIGSADCSLAESSSSAYTNENDLNKKRKAEALVTTRQAKMTRTRVSNSVLKTAQDQKEGEELSLAIQASLKQPRQNDVTKDELAAANKMAPYAAGDSAVPVGIEIKESIYPGYQITQSATVVNDGKIWVATAAVRGNEVQLGKFRSQTEAKLAIDHYYEKSKRKVVRARRNRSKNKQSQDADQGKNDSLLEDEDDDDDDSDFVGPGDVDDDGGSDDAQIDDNEEEEAEFEDEQESTSDSSFSLQKAAPNRTRKSTRRKNAISTEISSISEGKARDSDVSAVAMEQAVSMAYRNGNQVKDTGFSLHEWALVAIKDTEKAKWRGKFQEMKKARLGTRQRQLESSER